MYSDLSILELGSRSTLISAMKKMGGVAFARYIGVQLINVLYVANRL